MTALWAFPFSRRLPTGCLFPPLTHRFSPMAKPNSEYLPLAALYSPSTTSSTCFCGSFLFEASAHQGASANGSKLVSPDSTLSSMSIAIATPLLLRALPFHRCNIFQICVELRPSLDSSDLQVPRSILKHIVGKVGHMVARIEDYYGSFTLISECDANSATIRIWAGQCEFAKAVVWAISFGVYSVWDTIS